MELYRQNLKISGRNTGTSVCPGENIGFPGEIFNCFPRNTLFLTEKKAVHHGEK